MAGQTDLDKIIAELEDEEKISKIAEKHDEAYATFKGKIKKAATYDELMDKVMEYIKHHRKSVDKTELPDYMARVEAHNILVSYGRNLLKDEDASEEKAITAAIKHAKKGKLRDIIDAFKTSARESEESTYTRSIILKYLPPVADIEYKAGLAKQYLDRHGHLLSDEEKKDLEKKKHSSEYLAHKATELLFKHKHAKSEYKETAYRT